MLQIYSLCSMCLGCIYRTHVPMHSVCGLPGIARLFLQHFIACPWFVYSVYNLVDTNSLWLCFCFTKLKEQGLQDKIKLVPIDLQDRPAWYKEKVYPTNKVKLFDNPNYCCCLLSWIGHAKFLCRCLHWNTITKWKENPLIWLNILTVTLMGRHFFLM